MTQLQDPPSSSSLSPPATLAPSSSSSYSGSGGAQQFLADLNRELEDKRQRRQKLLQEKEELEAGRVDIGLLTGSPSRLVFLGPPEDDESVLTDLMRDPHVASAIAGRSQPGGLLGTAGSGNGPKKSSQSQSQGQESKTGTGPEATGAEAGTAEKQGILSGLLARFSWLGWLESRPRLSLITAVSLLVLGLIFNLLGISAFGDPVPGAIANATKGTPTGGAASSQTGGDTSLQVVTPTVAVVSPTAAVATATPAASPTPTASPPPDMSSEPHDGFLPPSKLQVDAVNFNISFDKLVKAKPHPNGLVAQPDKGVIYHFGAYPGERGNLVLVGDYDTLGAPLVELLQQNDEVQITDRKGSVFTYRVISYPRLLRLLGANNTPRAAAGTGTNPGATNLGPTPSGFSATTPGPGPGALSPVYVTATAMAAEYADDQALQITTLQDSQLLELPGTTAKDTPLLTLVSLPASKNPADPTRLVVRAVLSSYRPATVTPAGTPVDVGVITPAVVVPPPSQPQPQTQGQAQGQGQVTAQPPAGSGTGPGTASGSSPNPTPATASAVTTSTLPQTQGQGLGSPGQPPVTPGPTR
ncbi:MAG TPA: hypothetical protein VH186_15650 [Chloroflexia bacterium]|nr:hypothetical protein [Chloroflexia bacterium]